MWGGLILILAARTHLEQIDQCCYRYRYDPYFGLLSTKHFWIFYSAIGFGAALIIVGRFLPDSINEWLLRVIGLTSCLYAILDIKSDILDRSHLRSDARMLHEEITPYIPTIVWGVLWMGIAIGVTLCVLYIAGKDREKPEVLDNGE